MLIIDSDTPIRDGFDVIIPFNFFVSDGGELRLHAYESAASAARRFEELFGGVGKNPLSEKSLLWLDGELSEASACWGYEVSEKHKKSWTHIYRVSDITQVNATAILPSTVMLTPGACGFENATGADIEAQLDEGFACFATVEDGRIVSAACENPVSGNIPGRGGAEAEIWVETSPKYRRRGYAASNAAALAGHLVSNGVSVLYCCGKNNRASRKTAEAAGFAHEGRAYDYACYKIEK